MPDDVLLLGAANLQARERTSKSGAVKTRYTINVKGDTILVNTDPKSLSKGPADAIAALLRERISSISAVAAPATIKARAVAAKALARGEAWAVKRYGGGRTGTLQPNQSNRLFNDSGRMAQSIAVGATSDGYTVNVAANRLSPDTLNGDATGALARIWDLLKQYVPELADTRKLMDSIPVRRAVNDALAGAIKKADERRVEMEKQVMLGAIRAFASIAG